MEDFVASLSLLLLRFLQNLWGIINAPYKTYRRLVEKGRFVDIFPIFLLISFYFLFISPLKARSFHPFLLTYNFGLLLNGAFFTYFLIVVGIYGVGRILKGKGKIRQIAVCWGYSLIPTLLWFFITSFFYVFLPPPRQLTFLGKLFSIVFLSLSFALFFWKGILYYLTLRFGLKLDFIRILGASIIIFPLGMLYAYLMYQWGIFKIPFI